MCRAEHAGSTVIAREPLPDGTPCLTWIASWFNTFMFFQIFPDPPSFYMNRPRHSPPPSICMSDNTHIQASVRTRPSLQSLTSSEGHTAVSSHADMGSWYIQGYPQADLDQQNEKKIARGGKEVGGKSELPMHYIPASRLRKNKKRRSCSDMVWGTIVSAGRGIASCFETDTVEPVSASGDKL